MQRMQLPLRDLEIDVIGGDYPAEALVQPANFQKWRGHRQCFPAEARLPNRPAMPCGANRTMSNMMMPTGNCQ